MPLHNYPRTIDGVCAGCGCQDNSSGNYYATLQRYPCDGQEALIWQLCNVPDAWNTWVQGGATPGPYRVVYGQSDHLGVSTAQCWKMTTTESKKSGCFENQIDFADVFSDFGFSSPSDVPEDGYTSESDPFGACCEDNDPSDEFEPLVPKRYVLKFRNRGLRATGAVWWQADEARPSSRPPSLGTFTTSGAWFCGGQAYDTHAWEGGYFSPTDRSDFGLKEWASWSENDPIGSVDIEHGCDDCYPAAAANYEQTARVWWPTNQVHVDHDWEMGASLSSFVTRSDGKGWTATYINTSAEYELATVTSSSVCTDPTPSENGDEGGASGWITIGGTKPSSWCSYQTSKDPEGNDFKVPRNISKIRGDGLLISGTLTIKVDFLLPNTLTSYAGDCAGDYDAPPDAVGTVLIQDNQIDAASSVVRAWFVPDDYSDVPYRLWGNMSSTLAFAKHQTMRKCICTGSFTTNDCCFAGACPGDTSGGSGLVKKFDCWKTRFEIRPTGHLALDTSACSLGNGIYLNGEGARLDSDQVQFKVPQKWGFQLDSPAAPGGTADTRFTNVSNFGWNDIDYAPEPGVGSFSYNSGTWVEGMNEKISFICEYTADGCHGGTTSSRVNPRRTNHDGSKSCNAFFNEYNGWSDLEVQTSASSMNCARFDGSKRLANGSDNYDADDGPLQRESPSYTWADNHLIFEPHWD